MTSTSVAVRHNFETAHRLPHLGGKCSSVHGHSWWVDITVEGTPGEAGIVVDFGDLKREVRGWIDNHLDHGAMLSHLDPLLPAFRQDGGRVFVFDGGPSLLTDGLEWPTVENVAELLRRVATGIVHGIDASGLRVTEVRVTETHCNAATVTA